MFRIETRVDPDGTANVNIEVNAAPSSEDEATAMEVLLGYGAMISTCVAAGEAVTDFQWGDSEARDTEDDPELIVVNRTDVAYVTTLLRNGYTLQGTGDISNMVVSRLEKAVEERAIQE